MALGRWGANVELMLAAHHAIVASGYLQTFPTWILRHVLPSDAAAGDAPPSRLGGELGYRLYSGSKAPSGLFAGPSFVAMPLAYPHLGPDYRGEIVSFLAYGGAFDLGVQAVADGGFTLGGGVGVMYLAYSPPASVAPPPGVTAPTFPTPHVLPRLLLAAGWSF
jgi:hypothetical protein